MMPILARTSGPCRVSGVGEVGSQYRWLVTGGWLQAVGYSGWLQAVGHTTEDNQGVAQGVR